MPKEIKIPGLEQLSEETKQLYDILNKESDLACILIGANYLDNILASILEKHFIQSSVVNQLLNPLGGALGAFANRAKLCYCLGLISKGMYQNLMAIAEMRNEFAHKYLMLDFGTENIQQKVNELVYPETTGVLVDEEGTHDNHNPFTKYTYPRDEFTIIVLFMVNDLIIMGLDMERKQKPRDIWTNKG